MDIFFAIVITCVLFGFISMLITQRIEVISKSFLWVFMFVHIVLSATYLLYALNSPSDSRKYFKQSSNSEDWLTLFGTGKRTMENWFYKEAALVLLKCYFFFLISTSGLPQ